MTKTYSPTQCTTNSSKETSIQHIKIVENQGNTVQTNGLVFPIVFSPLPGHHKRPLAMWSDFTPREIENGRTHNR